MTSPIKYPSTSQFRQVVRSMNEVLTYDGYDEEKKEIKRKTPESFVVPYVGTVKIHGTNGSIVFHSATEVVFQSKERVLSLEQDNNGFMSFMVRKDVSNLLEQVQYLCQVQNLPFEYPVEIAGEWAGRGIQKGVAVSDVEPFFSVFRIAVGKDEKSGLNWLPPTTIFGIGLPEQRIYNILDFGYWNLDIPFNEPETVQNELVDLTNMIEEKCPAGLFFGVEGVGEGVVWSPMDVELAKNSGLWFKVKGDKHSVSKVKTLAEVDPVRLKNIQEFVQYAVTDNRMEQGVQEVGLDQTKIGQFLSWVSRDINKEEGDVLEANSLTMKDVAKFISNKARGFYMKKLSEDLNGSDCIPHTN